MVDPTREVPTRDTGLGIHVADLPTAGLPSGSEIRFAVFRLAGGRSGEVGVSRSSRSS